MWIRIPSTDVSVYSTKGKLVFFLFSPQMKKGLMKLKWNEAEAKWDNFSFTLWPVSEGHTSIPAVNDYAGFRFFFFFFLAALAIDIKEFEKNLI